MAHFRAAVDFSDEKLKPEHGLMKQIMYLLLGDYGEADQLELFRDSAPHSFNFAIRREGTTMINGGILLHGFGETFAVELSAPAEPHYSIHT